MREDQVHRHAHWRSWPMHLYGMCISPCLESLRTNRYLERLLRYFRRNTHTYTDAWRQHNILIEGAIIYNVYTYPDPDPDTYERRHIFILYPLSSIQGRGPSVTGKLRLDKTWLGDPLTQSRLRSQYRHARCYNQRAWFRKSGHSNVYFLAPGGRYTVEPVVKLCQASLLRDTNGWLNMKSLEAATPSGQEVNTRVSPPSVSRSLIVPCRTIIPQEAAGSARSLVTAMSELFRSCAWDWENA